MKKEISVAEVPCESCGKLVTIVVPAVGCVFCTECMKPSSYSTIGSEQFTLRYTAKKKAGGEVNRENGGALSGNKE